jgi:hypothetical protein
MWLFKPVFINGFGSRHLQWRDSPDASLVDRGLVIIKTLVQQIKPAAAFLCQQWQNSVLPLLKKVLKK